MIMTEVVGLYKDTVEDVVLPEYIYSKYLKGVGVEGTYSQRSIHGANVHQKLQNTINGQSIWEGAATPRGVDAFSKDVGGIKEMYESASTEYFAASSENLPITVTPGSPKYVKGELTEEGVVVGDEAPVAEFTETKISPTGERLTE